MATLNCAELYFIKGNPKKAKECMNKSKRISNFSMTNSENLPLFVIILNKFIHFIEATEGDEYFFDKDGIDNTFEIIKNHISIIKIKGDNQAFLPEAEKFFQDTTNIISKRAKEGKKALYGEIVI